MKHVKQIKGEQEMITLLNDESSLISAEMQGGPTEQPDVWCVNNCHWDCYCNHINCHVDCVSCF